MSILKTNSDFIKRNIIYKGVVVDAPDDKTGYKPFRCRIETVDDELKDNELAPCYPLLPKHLHIYPKKGEWVDIIMLEIKEGVAKSNQEKRYFIGPIISVFSKLNANYDDDAESDSPIKPKLENPDNGIYPPKEYTAILGRDNSDLIFRPQEVILRAGQHVKNKPLKFNNLDTGYVQIRYGNPKLIQTTKKVPITTTTIPIFKGFITATINNTSTINVIISIEDSDHSEIGTIHKSYNINNRNESINFIKDTFINLQQNNPTTSLLIFNTEGKNLPLSYDLNKFKFINQSIPELKNFNINPTTVKNVKYESITTTDVIFDGSKGSVVNVVGSLINLISHANKEGFKLLDPDQNITPEEQVKINNMAHPIPNGDALVDFLQLVKSVMTNHVHAYHGLPADPDKSVQLLLNFDLDSILNKFVRTA